MHSWIVAVAIAAELAASAAPKTNSKAAQKAAKKTSQAASGASGATGSGAEFYAPTKCEWLAVELNSNYRNSNIKNGFTLQVFCRPPGMIFLSYRYVAESDRAAALEHDDSVREAIAEVVRTRGWKWVKVDEEMSKVELKVAKPVTPPPKLKAKPKSEEEGDSSLAEGETIEPEEKPAEAPEKELTESSEEPPPVVDSIETKSDSPVLIENLPDKKPAKPSGE